MTNNEINAPPPRESVIATVIAVAVLAGVVIAIVAANSSGTRTPAVPTSTYTPTYEPRTYAPPVETQECALAKAMLLSFQGVPELASSIPAAQALVHATCDF